MSITRLTSAVRMSRGITKFRGSCCANAAGPSATSCSLSSVLPLSLSLDAYLTMQSSLPPSLSPLQQGECTHECSARQRAPCLLLPSTQPGCSLVLPASRCQSAALVGVLAESSSPSHALWTSADPDSMLSEQEMPPITPVAVSLAAGSRSGHSTALPPPLLRLLICDHNSCLPEAPALWLAVLEPDAMRPFFPYPVSTVKQCTASHNLTLPCAGIPAPCGHLPCRNILDCTDSAIWHMLSHAAGASAPVYCVPREQPTC